MSRPIAYVLQDAAKAPDPAAVVAALRQRHPRQPVELIASARGRAVGPMAMALRCAGVELIALAVGMPLPEEEWKLPAERALSENKSLWRDGPSVFTGHTAHLVVTTLADPSDRLLSARAIQAAVGALIAVLPGCGAVVWNSVVARPARWWEDVSHEAAFAPLVMKGGVPSHPGQRYTRLLNELLDQARAGVRDTAAPTAPELDLLTTRLQKITAFLMTMLAGIDPTAAMKR